MKNRELVTCLVGNDRVIWDNVSQIERQFMIEGRTPMIMDTHPGAIEGRTRPDLGWLDAAVTAAKAAKA